MKTIPYARDRAVRYAEKWALSRNPAYYDFERLGGDCTNFASQCIYAGSGIMNFTPITGWYYRSVNDRAPAWTGVEELYHFLTMNRSAGPFAEETSPEQAEIGDVVQLGTADGDFYHTPVVVATHPQILVAAHTFDALFRPLSSYGYERIRVLHIMGVRVW